MSRLLGIFFVILTAHFSFGENAAPDSPQKICVKKETRFSQSSTSLACLNCLAELTSRNDKKIDLSEKWATLLTVMAHNCPVQNKNRNAWLKTSDLFNSFGYCPAAGYEFEKSLEKNEDEKQIKAWADGTAILNYADPPKTQELFQRIFGLSYSTAFFYFCQLPEMDPKKKIDRLGRYYSFVGDSFKNCASAAAERAALQKRDGCSFYQVISPAAEVKATNLFMSTPDGPCTVISDLRLNTDTKNSIYQWICTGSTGVPAGPAIEKTNEPEIEDAPLGFPTEYPK